MVNFRGKIATLLIPRLSNYTSKEYRTRFFTSSVLNLNQLNSDLEDDNLRHDPRYGTFL